MYLKKQAYTFLDLVAFRWISAETIQQYLKYNDITDYILFNSNDYKDMGLLK